MTFNEFVEFISSGKPPIYVYPYTIAECHCGDVNCKGWRLLPATVPGLAPVERAEEVVGV